MKSLILLTLISFSIIPNLISQNINIGIKGGLNIYTIHNDNGAKYDNLSGFHIGLLGHIHLSKRLAFQPEILYSAQGAKYIASEETIRLKLGYINVPLLIQYMFDNGFRLEVGPQVGFLLKATSENNGNKTDVKSSIKSTDIGLALGIGYIHPNTGFGLDARYNIGLSNINENGSAKSMNRGFQIGLLYQFNHR